MNRRDLGLLASFDLAHMEGLSADRSIPLLLSPRSLYVLQNLANQDVLDPVRYDLAPSAFPQHPQEGTDDYALFLQAADAVGVELSERIAGVGTLLNYVEAIAASTIEENVSAGTHVLQLGGPGGGEAWVIDTLAFYNSTSQNSWVFARLGPSGGERYVASVQNPAAGIPYVIKGPFHLSEGWSFLLTFLGCVAGDDLAIEATGYIMDLV